MVSSSSIRLSPQRVLIGMFATAVALALVLIVTAALMASEVPRII
jgi:hypothetical protein